MPRSSSPRIQSAAPEAKETGGPRKDRRAAAPSTGSPPDRSPRGRSDAAQEASPVSLGERLRAIRSKLGLTLMEAAELTGTGTSTLSKIENGQTSPTYDVLQKIVQGLQIDLVDLFDTRQHVRPSGRRAITRACEGSMHVTPKYSYEALATELTHKRFFPLRARITARSPLPLAEAAPEIAGHAGEEFVYVLSGAVELHTEYYAPVRLEAGDSVYFDSTMRHALASVSEEDAEVLWIASQD
jgi:transcriptional regulator with XRE-family HTH domain